MLIKAVIQAIPTYLMSVFRPPSSLCAELSSLAARFWWGSSELKQKIHWLSWKKLCRQKSHGDMGFRDLEVFNQAMVAKQGWRILQSPNSLMSRTLRARHFRSCDFMEAKRGSNATFFWQSILWGRELLRLGLCWRVGNRECIRIFQDLWLPRPHTFKPITTGGL